MNIETCFRHAAWSEAESQYLARSCDFAQDDNTPAETGEGVLAANAMGASVSRMTTQP
ncbi:MAG: hypothetical protein FWD63_03515 [Propionibacteriaceae bacterium]|nr:hypothetical protein [Propionibacteriaceae bacterium]